MKKRKLMEFLKYIFGAADKDDVISALKTMGRDDLLEDLEMTGEDLEPLFDYAQDGDYIKLKEYVAGATVTDYCMDSVDPGVLEQELSEILLSLILMRELTDEEVVTVEKALQILRVRDCIESELDQYGLDDVDYPCLETIKLFLFISYGAHKDFARRTLRRCKVYKDAVCAIESIL